MRNTLALLPRVALSLAVALAIGAGANQALSASTTAQQQACNPCTSTKECNQCCINEIHAAGGVCDLPAGRCFCIN